MYKTDENGDLFRWSKVLNPQTMSNKLLAATGVPLPDDKTELVVQACRMRASSCLLIPLLG
jgi:hypothetical protein